MPATTSFIYFAALPPELRVQIWREALSTRSVWAAARNRKADSDVSAGHPSFTMVHIVSAPYLAGLSCAEARRLLEQDYVKPIRRPLKGSAASVGCYWVDLDSTVVYLGSSSDAMIFLNSFGEDELLRFKHVALTWYQFSGLARVCQHLARICPALRTIIMQNSETEAATNQPLRSETAAYFATIPDYVGPESELENLDTPYFRSLLLGYYSDSVRPRLHLLPSNPINRLP